MNVGHLVRGARLEELVQLQLFSMRKLNKCPKGFGLVSNFINFLGEMKNIIDFLIDFHIFYKSDIKTFLRIKFSYKLGCTQRLQLHSNFFIGCEKSIIRSHFLLISSMLTNFPKDQ